MLALADPDLDNGPRTDKSATMRMCAVSREVRPIDELIRFVISPTGEVIPDLKRKLPGRGLWVTASRRTVAEAVRRNQFSKGFKRQVRAAATLPDDTETLLVRSCTDARLAAVTRENNAESTNFPIISALTTDELDLALGRANVVHAALLAGSASKTFLSRCQILVRYRMADDDKTANAARNSD